MWPLTVHFQSTSSPHEPLGGSCALGVGLPIRPASARAILDLLIEEGDGPPRPPSGLAIDPGWVLSARRRRIHPTDQTDSAWVHSAWNLLAECPWWKLRGAETLAIEQLWRYSVATALAARKLAEESDDDPHLLEELGLLSEIGLWLIAARDPECLIRWLKADEHDRRRLEDHWFHGSLAEWAEHEVDQLGVDRELREVIGLSGANHSAFLPLSQSPQRLDLIHQARAWANRTPWSLKVQGSNPRGKARHPWLRWLISEVQVLTTGGFLPAEPALREETLSRALARERLIAMNAQNRAQVFESTLRALSIPGSITTTEDFQRSAQQAWSSIEGVRDVEVQWIESVPTSRQSASTDPRRLVPSRSINHELLAEGSSTAAVLPANTRIEIPLRHGCETLATVNLHLESGSLGPWSDPARNDALELIEGVWTEIARSVDRSRRVQARFDAARRALSGPFSSTGTERMDRLGRFEALAEFAAGAGHEINNPLAVIMGRAQLLVPKQSRPEDQQALRLIIAQAQRAHRMIKDLMYIARPPQPRPRLCQPEDILHAVVRDHQEAADTRGVRLQVATQRHLGLAWTDPELLRQIAEALIRNALEASRSGQSIAIEISDQPEWIQWEVHDEGPGLGAEAARHLFDPFYCGRQAGRGLGLGLPRAARAAGMLGGEIRWKDHPSQGAVFLARLPRARSEGVRVQPRAGSSKPRRVVGLSPRNSTRSIASNGSPLL